MIKPTENFDSVFWAYNYPLQLWRNPDTGNTSYIGYMPRKASCFESCDPIPADELDTFVDNAIAKLEAGIKLFKKFKNKEIDTVYYWDTEEEQQ